MSEISLIKDFINGTDPEGILYKVYVRNLYSYGVSMGFSGDTCMDAIHDVFCKLYNLNNKKEAEIKNVKHYLFTSLKNRLLDIYKREKKLDIPEDMETVPFNIEISILDSMIEKEDKEAIIKKVEILMSCLTSRQKEAIYLRYMQEMDYDEIASLLNMTPKSSKMLVYRAIGKMRDFTNDEKNIFFIILALPFLKG